MNENRPRWHHRAYVGLQYLLPHHLLSALMFRLTRVGWRPLRSVSIRTFIRLFGVDMDEALERDPDAYATFNAFFTRALRPGTRPIASEPNALLCPADGALSQLGAIAEGSLVQAKGLDYSLLELLGGHEDLAGRFAGGSFATVYLSPGDYHRVHMPAAGRLRQMLHIPGRLFSVNRVTTARVPRLFTRNERVVCLFEGEAGPFAVVLVGAIFVGSMETVWAGQVTPTRTRLPASQTYSGGDAPALAAGEELGRFNMGSTVILLLAPGAAVEWEPGLAPGGPVRMGQPLGLVSGPRPPRAAEQARRSYRPPQPHVR
jgi:phosphatidylserine decarboxylase